MIEPRQLAAARKRAGLTQTELARRSGVSQSLIAKIESHSLDPSYSRLRALSDVLEHPDGGPRLPVERVMHRDVVLMFATESVEQAIEHLQRHGISQLPVFDQGRLVGTITESSLLAYVMRRRSEPGALQAPVRQLMSEALPQVPPETEVEAVLPLLTLFPAVLVAANGRLQGIVTRSDLLGQARNPAQAAYSNPTSRPEGAVNEP